MHSICELFFNPRPFGPAPGSDGLLVPLDGLSLPLLRAPAHQAQESAEMIGMILDAGATPDHQLDPRTAPQIAGKACIARSFQKRRFQLQALRSHFLAFSGADA